MQLGSFDQALPQMWRPGWEAMHKKYWFQQGQITGQGRVRQSGIPADVGEIRQTGCAGGEQFERVGQLVQGIDPRQIAHVPLQNSGEVGCKPR